MQIPFFKEIRAKTVKCKAANCLQISSEKSNAFAISTGSLFLGYNDQQGFPVPNFQLSLIIVETTNQSA